MFALARSWYLLVGVVAAIYAAGALFSPLSSGCRVVLTQEDFQSAATSAASCATFLDVPVIVAVALLALLALLAATWSVADAPPRGLLARAGIVAGIVGSFMPAFLLASLFGPGREPLTAAELALGGIPAMLGIVSAVVLWRHRPRGAVRPSTA